MNLCKLLRCYIYLAMVVKLFFVLRYFFIGNGDINILLGELVAWTIILVSPICDALIEKELKK